MRKFLLLFSLIFIFVQVFSVETFAQKRKSKTVSPPKSAKKQSSATKTKVIASVPKGNPLPKVTAVNTIALTNLLKREGENAKPLLINFWATWCDPCREEFPDLVKLDTAYRGKIDFITVSLDDLADINTLVPKFLTEVKAQMPAYLLKTADESAAITMVAKDWSGNLPMTVLFAPSGETAYVRMGKVKYDTVTAEIDKILIPLTIK